MPESPRDLRRLARKHVLEALIAETGSPGGDPARVRAYCADPIGASTSEFGYVGGLALVRFYIAPGKPDAGERRSLWMNLLPRLGKPLDTSDPGGWSGETLVMQLQAIAEEA